MKLYIYVTDPVAAARGKFDWSLNASTRDDLENTGGTPWKLVGSVEADLDVGKESMTQLAVVEINKKIAEVQADTEAKITKMIGMRDELLAITHQDDSDV